jgi:hypothetical protein
LAAQVGVAARSCRAIVMSVVPTTITAKL